MKAKKQVIIYVSLGVVAWLLVVGFTIYYRQGLVIMDGSSMEPTIQQGQEVKVIKYGQGQTPARGDIIEYSKQSLPVAQHTTNSKLIHRIIALPGERIVIAGGKVTVYNSSQPQGFNPDAGLPIEGMTNGTIDEVLPLHSYFVMGDNRPHALDSRVIGPVNQSDIIGKVKS